MNKCKRCKYFDRLDNENGLCDKDLEIHNHDYHCSKYKSKPSPPLKT